MPRKPAQTYPPVWSEIEWPHLTVLSWDQTFSHAGWALLQFRPGANPRAQVFGTVDTSAGDDEGFEANFRRTDEVGKGISMVLDGLAATMDIDLIVHEMPAIKGHRRDSSLMAAVALRTAVKLNPDFGVHGARIEMQQNQQMKRWLTGDGSAAVTKAMVRSSLWAVMDEFKTNEHVIDACALGVVFVARQVLA